MQEEGSREVMRMVQKWGGNLQRFDIEHEGENNIASIDS